MVFGTFLVESLRGGLRQLSVMIQISRAVEILQVVDLFIWLHTDITIIWDSNSDYIYHDFSLLKLLMFVSLMPYYVNLTGSYSSVLNAICRWYIPCSTKCWSFSGLCKKGYKGMVKLASKWYWFWWLASWLCKVKVHLHFIFSIPMFCVNFIPLSLPSQIPKEKLPTHVVNVYDYYLLGLMTL